MNDHEKGGQKRGLEKNVLDSIDERSVVALSPFSEDPIPGKRTQVPNNLTSNNSVKRRRHDTVDMILVDRVMHRNMNMRSRPMNRMEAEEVREDPIPTVTLN